MSSIHGNTLSALVAAIVLVAAAGDFAAAATYENRDVCAQYRYQPFRNVDYCLDCCKQAGYTEKGEDKGMCSCKGAKATPGPDDIQVPEARLTVYENQAVCAQFMYKPFRNVDYCLNCCKQAGYTQKGRELTSQATCTCKAEKAKPDADDIVISIVSDSKGVVLYENDKVCKQYPYYNGVQGDPTDKCMDCCLANGYTGKGKLWSDDSNGDCTCKVAGKKTRRDDFTLRSVTSWS